MEIGSEIGFSWKLSNTTCPFDVGFQTRSSSTFQTFYRSGNQFFHLYVVLPLHLIKEATPCHKFQFRRNGERRTTLSNIRPNRKFKLISFVYLTANLAKENDFRHSQHWWKASQDRSKWMPKTVVPALQRSPSMTRSSHKLLVLLHGESYTTPGFRKLLLAESKNARGSRR